MLSWFKFSGERKAAIDISALIDIGARTAAGISVNPNIALKRCVSISRAASIRCDVLGALPLALYKRGSDGGKDKATDHPLYKLIHDRPNGWTSAPEFIAQLELDCLSHGYGRALANRSGDKIVELIRIDPGSITKVVDEATLEPRYEVTLKGGGKRTYHWRDILDVPTLGNLAAIKQAAEAIGLLLALEGHASKIIGNGGRPSGILKAKGKLGPDAFDRLRKSWSTQTVAENAGKTAILEDDMSFEPLTFNSVDLQFMEMRAFQVIEIARATGVPPSLMMDFGRATWGNSEQMAQGFLTFTLLPRTRLWSGAVARLLSEEEQALYVPEFVTDAIVQAEIAARFEAYTKAIASRVLNPNEVRAKENLPPYEGGDEFINPNIQPAGKEPAQPVSQAKPRIAA